MDPNESLNKVREYAREVQSGIANNDPHSDVMYAAARLAEAFFELDTWLSTGGFEPNEWDMS